MCGAIEKAGVNSVLEGDLLENNRSHIRSMETPVETSLRSELYAFFFTSLASIASICRSAHAWRRRARWQMGCGLIDLSIVLQD